MAQLGLLTRKVLAKCVERLILEIFRPEQQQTKYCRKFSLTKIIFQKPSCSIFHEKTISIQSRQSYKMSRKEQENTF